jgi:hypothetical protein
MALCKDSTFDSFTAGAARTIGMVRLAYRVKYGSCSADRNGSKRGYANVLRSDGAIIYCRIMPQKRSDLRVDNGLHCSVVMAFSDDLM